MPVDVLGDAVDVLLQLPDQPALADAARSGDRHQPNPPVAADRMEDVLQLAQLLLAPDEWRFEASARPSPPRLPRRAAPARPAPARSCPSASGRRAARRRWRRSAARRVASPTSTVPASATPCRRAAVLTRSPATMPWFVALERDRRLAGQDAGSCLEVGVQRLDRVDELQPRADRALGVVLVGDRRAPDRHDRVADELLDDPAVDLHDPRRGVEVRAQQLADGLGVAVLGDRREADEVGEEDGDQPPFGLGGRGRRPSRGRCRIGRYERVSAARAEARIGCGSARRSSGRSRRGRPHSCHRTCCRPGSRSRMPRRSRREGTRWRQRHRANWHGGCN